ncbi:MAG: DUF1289 domain-containing protein [Candidatus Binatia bacterium]
MGVCRLESGTDRCEGCLRTLGEIAEWAAATNQRRRQILDAVEARRPSTATQGTGKASNRPAGHS